MVCHRISELLELLEPEWQKNPDLNLLQFLQQAAKAAGFTEPLVELTDDTLIYYLKMINCTTEEAIPGLKKDYEADFKSAILRARGILKDSE